MKPLAIDLFCGLGGWSEGLLAESYEVVGFDIERHVYGDERYPTQLVIQDVLTLHGRQFRDAALIVASPPCQAYSYRAMPWRKAKALPPPSNDLFEACFRIQREASEAAGHKIPLVVENVCGAQKWVGRAKWHYGSYYLWGDVPALMPIITKGQVTKPGMTHQSDGSTSFNKVPGFRFDGSGKSFQTASCAAYKTTGINWSDRSKHGQDFTRIAGQQAMDRRTKNSGGSWFNIAHNKESGCRNNPVNAGVKQDGLQKFSSNGNARKRASAMIAKIPFELARHIAWAWMPKE